MNLYDIKTQDVSVRYGDNPTGKVLGLIPYKGNVFGLTYDISKPREINITNHENERVEVRNHKRNKMKTCN